MVSSIQSIGITSGGHGVSLVAGTNNNSQNPILVVKSLIAGPGISIVPSTSLVDVTITATGLPALTSLIIISSQWSNAAPNPLAIFTAAYPVIVTAILGRVETVSTVAATLTLAKVPNGSVISDGTALTSAALNAAAMPQNVQNLPLVADISVLTLAVGDSIAVQTTGTWTAASGSVTVHMAPALQTN